jgi:phosphomannomutase
MNRKLTQLPVPDHNEVLDALHSYIISASGWRAIFSPSKDPEDGGTNLTAVDTYITAVIGRSYARFLSDQSSMPVEKLSILVATDTRPTGPAIAEAIITVLVSMGVDVTYIGVAPAPETMAYSELSGLFEGFIYISASHNPKGYNGIKFGRGGSVLDGTRSESLKQLFLAQLNSRDVLQLVRNHFDTADPEKLKAVYDQIDAYKERSLDAYRMFTGSVAAGSSYICGQDQIYNTIRAHAEKFGLGVLADFNGSSRTLSIDEQLFDSMGVSFRAINTTPGVFAHRIVPEGESLNDCRQALEQAWEEDPSFVIGYVPDCDGDRGNIVYIDEQDTSAKILEAQQVFALCVLSELAYIATKSEKREKLAVVVNGPTSMRIDEIARHFGAEVHRAEVGEAHAVELAQRLRDEGFTVRILGEGSNGGNITHPAKVRDPINTLISLLKLLSFRQQSDNEGLFEHWCRISGQSERYNPHFSLTDVIASLPSYTTTSAYESRAVMEVETSDQERLKSRYETLFQKYWDENRSMFTKMGIFSWKEFNTVGIHEVEGTGPQARKLGSTGGLKIAFCDKQDRIRDYIWMRGSKTEPVMRILSDCRGNDPGREDTLLTLHRELINLSDRS